MVVALITEGRYLVQVKRQTENAEKLVVGIDLHPDCFAAAAFRACSDAYDRYEWLHSKVSTSHWSKWLKKNVPLKSILVIEAGGNSFSYAEKADQLGYQAVVINSRDAGKIAKSYCKNDKDDAVKLARIYLSGLLLEHVWKPDKVTKIRRELQACYRRTVKDSTRSKNRLKSFLNGQGIRLRKGTRLTIGQTEEEILSSYSWTVSQATVISCMFDNIRYSDKKRKELYDVIAKEVLSQPMMRELMVLCGIRILCAFSIMAAVGDINRFKTPKKLVAYLGLSPRVRQSGNSKSTSHGISRSGRRETKTLLIQAAQAVLRSKNKSGEKLRKWGYSLMFRKDKNTAVVAVARKLAVAAWYLMKGYLPETVDIESDLKRKFKKIAEELTLEKIRAMGYRTAKEFVNEYSQCVLLKT